MGLNFKFSADDIVAQGRTRKKDIKSIKNWNRTTETKYIPILPDELVVVFLLSCSNDLEETKKTIKKFYKIKKMYPLYFDNRDMDAEDIKLSNEAAVLVPVYWPEKNISIVYCKLLDTDYKKFNLDAKIKIALMITDMIYYENQGERLIIVIDAMGTGLMHLTRLKIESLKALFTYIQEGMPLQLIAIHFVNFNYVLSKFIVLAKMLMNPDLYNKLQMHQGYEALHQFIPKEYIPSNYGGDLEAAEELQKDAIQKLRDMEKFWEAEERMRKECLIYNNNNSK